MIQATGEGGELARSGRVIATLGKWTLHSDPEGLVITASAKSFDTYALPRTSLARVTLTVGKSVVKYSVMVKWDGQELRLTRGG